MIYASLVVAAAAFLSPTAHMPASVTSRRAVSPVAIASTPEERKVLARAVEVTTIAKRFGQVQGQAAQTWVQNAVAGKDGDALMEMQLALFDECSVDDESGRCKALGEAIEAMKLALEEKAPLTAAEKLSSPKAFNILKGKTPIQEAANKVRDAASRFGPAQKSAANEWIKMVTIGVESSAVTSGFRESLLAQKITLFGECLLSEDGSPTDCEQLSDALASLQDAIELRDAEPKPEPAAAVAASSTAGVSVNSWYDSGNRLDGSVGSVVPTQAAATKAVAPTAAAVAAEPSAALNALMQALRQATQGRDAGTKSAVGKLESVIATAIASGVDADKVQLAQEVVASKGKIPAGAATFW